MASDPEIIAEKPKRFRPLRLLLKLFVFTFILCLLAAVFAAVGGYIAYEHIKGPGTPGEAVRISIPKGANGKDVGRILAENDLVEHELLFRAAVRLDKSAFDVKYGDYELQKGSSPLELLHILYEGPNVSAVPGQMANVVKVTVPEGLTITQAAELFDDPAAFVEAASDSELLERLGLKTATAEGFLMPNTYYFDGKPSEKEVVERMADQFLKEYAGLMKEIPEADGRDRLEIVTLASLVEEEAVADAERADISAVIHNRIRLKRRLEMDSTLQYALGKYGQRMLNTDKETESPYNTYKHAGLPPGPISNPGVASLRAALQPSDKKYLYFVSNADGKTHTFSTNLNDHNRARAEYNRKMRVARTKERQEREKSDAKQ